MKINSSEKQINALWLPSWYPNREHLFLGSFTRRDAEAVSAFCNLKVLYVVESSTKSYEVVVEKRQQGFEEIRVYYPVTGNRLVKLWRYFYACNKGFKFIKEKGFRPDLLHVHVIWHAGLAGLFYRWRYKLPIIATEHWSGYHLGENAFKGIHKLTTRFFAKKAKCILTVSEGQSKAMQRLGIRGSYLSVPNVVDIQTLPRKINSEKSKTCRFIHVSSLHDEQKNISGMLRVFSKLAAERQDFSLTMVGGLDHLPKLKRVSEELGLAKMVKFTGMVDHKEVMKLLSRHDVFVMFSNHEGLPCSMLEAMGVGLPVISTAIDGLEKWVTEETGMLVPIGDETALLDALTSMVAQHKNYSSEKISKLISDRCSYETVGRRIAGIYSRL